MKEGDKIVHYNHYEDRQNIVSKIGYDTWKKRTGLEKEYGDIPPPLCFSDLFNTFIDIFYLCPNGITYQDITAYCASTQNTLSIYEVGLIRKMASWAASE